MKIQSYWDFLKRDLPTNQIERVNTLAKELAEGALTGLWPVKIGIQRAGNGKITCSHENLLMYLHERWNNELPNLDILLQYDFLQRQPTAKTIPQYAITKDAFELINKTSLVFIFISYKRSESSAFAMYVLTRLKMASLDAFVDMSLIPGEDWHAGLQERIKEYDYLVALIGKETLKSDVCIKELDWAIEAGLTIIPVCIMNLGTFQVNGIFRLRLIRF